MINIIQREQPDIMILVETKLAGKSCFKIDGYNQVIQRNRKELGGGLLIAVKNNTGIEMIILNIEDKQEIMWVKIKMKHITYMIGVVYGYAAESRTSDEEIEEWYFNLEKEISKYSDEKIIIVGDFNAHVGRDDLGIPNNHENINQNGEKLRSLVERRELIMINATHKCKGKWTREDPNGTKSILDYVITNEHAYDNIKNMIIDEEHNIKFTRFLKSKKQSIEKPSDHNTITFLLHGQKTRENNKMVIWNLKNKETLQKFKEDTSIIQMKEDWCVEGDIDKKYKKWSKQIKSLMHKNLHRVTVKDKITNDIIKNEMHMKREINKEIKRLQMKGINGVLIDKLKEQAQKVIEKIIAETEQEKAKKLKIRLEKILNYSKTNDIWSMRKKCLSKKDQKMAIKNKKGEILTTKEQIFEEYESHYKGVLTNRTIKEEYEIYEKEINKQIKLYKEIKEYDQDEINKPFTEKEMSNVIKSLKNGKSPGPDEISNELLINAGENLIKNLLNMLNYFWKYEKIPKELMKITIKSIYKGKGETNMLDNHRGIFLSSVILKIFEKLIMNRVSPKLERETFTEYQAGGRPFRSTRDQLFILRAIMEWKLYNKEKMVMQFMDLSKAFDKMVLKNIMNNLWSANIRGKTWRMILAMNEFAELNIKTPFGISNEFTCTEILKQGSVMASTLAALHVDSVHNYFQNENLGVYYGDVRVENLIFQDDIIRFENSENQLNTANIIFEIFQNINKMEFHPVKTKAMIINGNMENINLGKHIITYTDKMKYLGDIIHKSGKMDELIKERKNIISGITAELITIMAQINSDTEIQEIITYIKGIIIPKLLVNSETWNNITKDNMQDLETIQSKAIKRLLKIPYSTPNKGLLNELGLLSVENEIIKRKIMYMHHIINGKNQLLKDILQQQTKLPGSTWIENTKNEMINLDLGTDFEEISKISKYQMRKIVTEKIWCKQKSEIANCIEESKKCRNMEVNIKKPKNYISELPTCEAKTILLARLKMIHVKTNFKGMYPDNLNCSFCGGCEETLQHLVKCEKLAMKINLETSKNIINLDEFENEVQRSDVEKLKIIAKMIQIVMNEREDMIKKTENESECEVVASPNYLPYPITSLPNTLNNQTKNSDGTEEDNKEDTACQVDVRAMHYQY